MKVELVYARHGGTYTDDDFESVQECADYAIRQEDMGEIFALEIRCDGLVIWSSPHPSVRDDHLYILAGRVSI